MNDLQVHDTLIIVPLNTCKAKSCVGGGAYRFYASEQSREVARKIGVYKAVVILSLDKYFTIKTRIHECRYGSTVW